ncbi:3'-5' exonuclease [Paraglaciecola polaris]|uniref:DNA polymerase III subunit epsilon n=1 Tax=Paraglaciecola polaris LMG 21857 TaxID=1129793 RepID=K6ZZ07_9ALTE|nr:3'-5' exonuclease [Paraglaciecola polaris]GAC33968.1 DNA polymerase III subunit epsilon [Paraglaciecola polaris LMG 21857]
MWQKIRKWFAPKPQIPPEWLNMPLREIPFLCIDLELTSLNLNDTKILSIGWVEGKGKQIAMQSCFYQVVSTTASLNQSPVIHGLTAQDIAQGQPVRIALEELKQYASSHIWVFHCTGLDMTVLNGVFKKLNIPLPTVVTLDTLRFGLYQLTRNLRPPPPNAVVLPVCRARYNLPAVPAHNALDDAMATMELLFAQIQKFAPQNSDTLKSLLITDAIDVFPAPLDQL